MGLGIDSRSPVLHSKEGLHQQHGVSCESLPETSTASTEEVTASDTNGIKILLDVSQNYENLEINHGTNLEN